VGKAALELDKISKAKIKTTDGFVVPVETLKKIAHHNNLTEKIKLIEDTNDWDNELLEKKLQKKISQLIKKQNIPEDVSHDIIKTYHKYILKNDFASIRVNQIKIDNITGESNLLESILEAWSQAITRQNLLKEPVLILVQKQPTVSGFIQPSPEKKYYYQLQTVHGVFDKQLGVQNKPDRFEINVSHNTIITRHLNPRKIELTRKLDGYKKVKNKNRKQAAITDQQAIEISKIAQTINQKFIGNRKIYFEIYGKHPFITDITSITNDHQPETDPILIGQSITGGYVEGFTQVVKNNQEKLSFLTGHILIKKNLTHLDLKLINHAAAIIIEDKKLAPAVLKLITDNHIPCITGVSYATTRLKNNQKIIVDTGSGKVFIKKEQSLERDRQSTVTKIYLSAGNPFRTEQYINHQDGIFLKSDYAIAFMGIHPNHLLKTRKKLLEQNLTRTIKAFFNKDKKDLFYRSCNLNSYELNSLTQSLNYEKEELNPYLGTRGALKIIQDSLLFEKELKIVAQIAHQQKREVNFVIPFVRTASELALIFQIIEKTIPKNSYLKYWLQLNTPANIFNLKEYLHLPISGVTFQAKTIHDLAYGIDPDNPDLLSHYSLDSNLVNEILSKVVEIVKNSSYFRQKTIGTLPIVVKLNQFNHEVVSKSVKLGVKAIVVKPSLLDIVKQQIISTEKNMVDNH
jgi:phosphoenolpyruvate synthase/pyruvate phosphate dikinase